ncbi:IS5 family transposase [Rhizobium sp.]|uniref:IS5 family transposase n=1 Tax=Rhizobium sp. TaxID=391 RepID=UPI0034C698AB
MTLWMTPAALSSRPAPKRTMRGGQPRYSCLPIETALTLALVFSLRLRQMEGSLTSVLQLTGLDLAVPHHATLSRRASLWRSSDRRQSRPVSRNEPVHVLIDSTGPEVYGAGQWLEEKHDTNSRRTWRKLHLALDADSGEIIAHVMTDQDTGNGSQVEPLLGQIDTPIRQITPDGAYGGKPTYNDVIKHGADAVVVIPPRNNAINCSDTETASQRDRHIAAINTGGRMKWQAATCHGKRSLVETAIVGHRLRPRSFRTQQTEVAIGCTVLNRMLASERPKSVRCKPPTT